MDKNNPIVVLCMIAGMLLGLALGCVVGFAQGRVGIPMCYGFVLGAMGGLAIGTAVQFYKAGK